MNLGFWELLASAATIAATIGLWIKVIRPTVTAIKTAWTITMAVHELIQAQLQPNGGSSLIDKVDRLEQRSEIQRAEIKEIKECINSWKPSKSASDSVSV